MLAISFLDGAAFGTGRRCRSALDLSSRARPPPCSSSCMCHLLIASRHHETGLARLSTQTRRAAMAAKHKPLADGAVQPHSNIRTNLAAREPRLWVVDVAVLVNELQRNGAASVLRELHDPQSRRLLRSILLTTDESDFALVSYRQQRNANDTFTMDPSSLESAVAVAAEAGVQSLWLDAWCHKVEGEYDHFNFCSTLTNVVRNARLVVWLPRARPDSTPGYQFRLWCSFEGSCDCSSRTAGSDRKRRPNLVPDMASSTWHADAAAAVPRPGHE